MYPQARPPSRTRQILVLIAHAALALLMLGALVALGLNHSWWYVAAVYLVGMLLVGADMCIGGVSDRAEWSDVLLVSALWFLLPLCCAAARMSDQPGVRP